MGVLSTILTTSVIWIIQDRHYKLSMEQIRIVESVTISLLMQPATESLRTENYSMLQELLQQVSQNPRINAIAVANIQGKIVASTDSTLQDSLEFNSRYSVPGTRIHQPISDSSGILGTMEIALSNKLLTEIHQKIRTLGIQAMLMGVLIIGTAALATGTMLTRRLARIQAAAQEVSTGNFDVNFTNENSYDELGQLEDAFSKMLYTIKENVNQRHYAEIELQNNYQQLLLETAEKEHTEDQWRRFVESAPDATIIMDREGIIELCNQQAQSLCGYTEGELIGKSAEMLAPERLRPFDRNLMDNVIHNSSSVPRESTFEYRLLTKSGQELPIEFRLSSVGRPDKPLISVSIRNVSARKNEEKQRQQLRSELAQATRINSLSQLATGLAHEVSQPLTAITANIDTLLGTVTSNTILTAEHIVALQEIEEHAHQAGTIIRALRRFIQKDETGQDTIDIKNLVAETVEHIQSEARDKGISISVNAMNQLNPYVDRVQIIQVLINLIQNSIDAINSSDSERKSITISIADQDDMIKISVEDTGPGIIEEQNLFKPFKTSKKGGLGIGLTISRSIIESYGGHLWSDTNSSEGVKFTFTLPTATG